MAKLPKLEPGERVPETCYLNRMENQTFNTMNTLPAVPETGYPMTVPPMDTQESASTNFPMRKFLRALLKYWWLPAITLVLCVGGTVAYLRNQPPTFVSNARMWETEKLRLPDGAVFTEDPQNYLGTQTELLRSERLRGLALGRLRTGSNTVPVGKDGEAIPVDLSIKQTPKSSVFLVQASSANPDFTRSYLDALMVEFIEYKKNVRKVVSGSTLASISAQVTRLETELKENQDALTAFQRTNNLAILQEEATIAGGYLARLKTQVSDLKLESKILDGAAAEQATTNSSALALEPITGSDTTQAATARNDGMSAAREIELLKVQRAKLSKYMRPKHPKIVKIDSDIEKAQKVLEMYRKQSREQLMVNRQTLTMRLQSVQDSIKEWEDKVIESNRRIADAERLKLNVTRAQSLYDRLVNLLQNVDISRNIDRATLDILEPASRAERSYRGEITLLAASIFAGLAIGIGIVFLVAVRDDRFLSAAEVTEKIGDAVVAQVPDVSKMKNIKPLALLEHDDERHVYAESYRSLRSAILYLAIEGTRPKVLLVTSAVPNEGKSTVAANLARTLAMGGARVLLVDGDMRKGRLHEYLGQPSGPGLADILEDPAKLQSVIRQNSIPNLYFISRGGPALNPGDLFLSTRLNDLLERMRQLFDHIVIDSSPVFAADDSSTLAPKVDGILFVVRSGFSRAAAVREALELLNKRQANILGVVFNRANASAKGYHYYKYEDYYAVKKAGS